MIRVQTFCVLVMFLAAVQVAAAQAVNEYPQLTVSVYNDGLVPADVLLQAEHEAATILEHAGIEVFWVNCTPGDHNSLACNHLDDPGHLALRFVRRPIHSMDPSAFGVAFLSREGTGRYADVFYSLALQLHQDRGVSLPAVLGCVMAHELGHLLLGSNAHTPAGIMRAQWQGDELHGLERGALRFSPEQGRRMQARLSAWTQSQTAQAVPGPPDGY